MELIPPFPVSEVGIRINGWMLSLRINVISMPWSDGNIRRNDIAGSRQ
jgi:hypothetical protein